MPPLPPTASPVRWKTISRPFTGFRRRPPRVHQRDRPPARALPTLGERHGQAAVRARPPGARALQGRPAHRGGPPCRAPHGAAAPADRGLPGRVPRLLLGHRTRGGRAAGARGVRHAGRADGRRAGPSCVDPHGDPIPDRRRHHPGAGLHAAVRRAGRATRSRSAGWTSASRSGCGTWRRSGSSPGPWSRCSTVSPSADRSPSRRAARSR